MGRLFERELVEEDLRQLSVPVLAVWTTTSSIPASRRATESGADLMNCGRLPTTERIFTKEGFVGEPWVPPRWYCGRLPTTERIFTKEGFVGEPWVPPRWLLRPVADDREDLHEGGGSWGNHGFPTPVLRRLPTMETIFIAGQPTRGPAVASRSLSSR